MAVTALRVQEKNIMIITTVIDNILVKRTTQATETWEPTGEPIDDGLPEVSEEAFHKKLRISADERGQLIRRYSSDPEWNPLRANTSGSEVPLCKIINNKKEDGNKDKNQGDKSAKEKTSSQESTEKKEE